MPYQESVISRISRATTTVQSADLGTLMFVTANNYTPFRTLSFGSFQEVREDTAIQSNSNTYKGLRLAFSAGASRVMLGRRTVGKAIYKPQADRIGKVTVYSLTVKTGTDTIKASYTSQISDTAEQIVTGLASNISASPVAVSATPVGVGAVAVLEIADSTTINHVVPDSAHLDVEFETTETAADLLGALLDEAEEDFYRLACEDHSESFILAMAAEIQATNTSNYPKRYVFTTQQTEVLQPLADPAVDILGKVRAFGYTRTEGRWHNLADTLFEECYTAARIGTYIPGTTNYKFIIPESIPAAADPVTLKRLSTGKQGYIKDRNASWFGEERKQNFNHGGKTASGEWADIIDAVDYLNDLIEVNLLNLQLNAVATGGKIAFTKGDKVRVANVVDGILKRAVDLKILTGFEPTTIPDNTPFVDQANRILQQIKWTGYLAGAVNFMIVDGILTYKDESLN